MIYSCRWGGCPSVFPSHPKLIAHLQEEHFTDEALDRDVGFRKGGFTEWLKVTGREGGTQSTSDNWLPSQVVHDDHPSPQLAKKPLAARTSPSRGAEQAEVAKQNERVAGVHLDSKYNFNSLATSSHTPLSTPTPPIPSPNPSPSSSDLASRRRSHIPDLSPVPARPHDVSLPVPPQVPRSTRSPSSARKRRRHNTASPERVGDSSASSVEAQAKRSAEGLLPLGRRRSESVDSSTSSGSSQSSQDVELQLTQTAGPETRQNSPEYHDSDNNDNRGIAGLSEGDLERVCQNRLGPVNVSPGHPRQTEEQISERPIGRDTDSHIPSSQAHPRTRSRVPRVSGPGLRSVSAAPSDQSVSNTRVLRRSSRARSTTPSIVPPPPSLRGSIAPSTNSDKPANSTRRRATRSQTGSRAQSVERQSLTSTRKRARAVQRKDEDRMDVVDEVAEDAEEDPTKNPTAQTNELSPTPGITASRPSRPPARFKSGVLTIDDGLDSSPRPQPRTQLLSQPSQNPFVTASSPADGYGYTQSQPPLLTQKPYFYPSQDSADSQESQRYGIGRPEFSQDGSEVGFA